MSQHFVFHRVSSCPQSQLLFSSLTDAARWENPLLHRWKNDSGCHLCIFLGILEHSWQWSYYSLFLSCPGPHKHLCGKLEIQVGDMGSLQIPGTMAIFLTSPQSLLTWTFNLFTQFSSEVLCFYFNLLNLYFTWKHQRMANVLFIEQ